MRKSSHQASDIATTNRNQRRLLIDSFTGQNSNNVFRCDAFGLYLFNPVLEYGENAGDAPWAAANTIADFLAEMLSAHKKNLEKLAAEEWTYLLMPARCALAKTAAVLAGIVLALVGLRSNSA